MPQRIVKDVYPESNRPVDLARIKFVSGPEILRTFYYRLAFYCAFYGCTIEGYGFKSLVKQAQLYMNWKNGVVGANPAAPPGSSRHNYGIAFDVNRIRTNADGSAVYPATINADFLLEPTKQTLAKFGLYIPMWKGHPTTREAWHIEPIETLGYSGNWWDFLELDDEYNTASGRRRIEYQTLAGWTGAPLYIRGKDVAFVQGKVGAAADGVFGPGSAKVVSEFRVANGLPASGVVDDALWAVLTRPAPVTDYKVLYESLKAACDATQAEVVSLRSEIAKYKSDLTTQSTLMQTIGESLDRANAKIVAAKAALNG